MNICVSLFQKLGNKKYKKNQSHPQSCFPEAIVVNTIFVVVVFPSNLPLLYFGKVQFTFPCFEDSRVVIQNSTSI